MVFINERNVHLQVGNLITYSCNTYNKLFVQFSIRFFEGLICTFHNIVVILHVHAHYFEELE